MLPVKAQIVKSTRAIHNDTHMATSDAAAAKATMMAIAGDKVTVRTDIDQLDVAKTALKTAKDRLARAQQLVQATKKPYEKSAQIALAHHKAANALISKIAALTNTIATQTETSVGPQKIKAAQALLASLRTKLNRDNQNAAKALQVYVQAQKEQTASQATLLLIQQALQKDGYAFKVAQIAAGEALTFQRQFLKENPLQKRAYEETYNKLAQSYAVQVAFVNHEKMLETNSLKQLQSATKAEKADKIVLNNDQNIASADNKQLTNMQNKSSLYKLANLLTGLQVYRSQLSGWNNGVNYWIKPDISSGGTFETPIKGQSENTNFWQSYSEWSAEELEDNVRSILGIDKRLSDQKNGISSKAYNQIIGEGEELTPLNNPLNSYHSGEVNDQLTPEIEASLHTNETATYGSGELGELFSAERQTNQAVSATAAQYHEMQGALKAAQAKATVAQNLVSQQQLIVDHDQSSLNQAHTSLSLNQTNAQLLETAAQGFNTNSRAQQKTLEASEATLRDLQQQATTAQSQVKALQQVQNGLIASLNVALTQAKGLQEKAHSLRDSWAHSGEAKTLAAYNESAQELNNLNQTIFDLSGMDRENLPIIIDPATQVQNSNEEVALQSMENQMRENDLQERLTSEPLLNEPFITDPDLTNNDQSLTANTHPLS